MAINTLLDEELEPTSDTVIASEFNINNSENNINDVLTQDFPNITDNNDNINDLQNNNSFLENYQNLDYTYKESQNNQIIKREKLFNTFLESYTKEYKYKSEQKRKLKYIFFIVILVILGIIVISSIILLIVLLNLKLNLSNIIITLVSTSAEIITSLLILPKIIAEYLFDKEEEQHLNEIISKMQDYNLNSKNIKSNNTNENS